MNTLKTKIGTQHTYKLFQGDNLEAFQLLEDESIDGVITDSPYGIKFLKNAWDSDVASADLFKIAFRKLKAGAYFICFGHGKTIHRIATRAEDQGFEVCDTISWIYGNGMRHSQDYGREIERVLAKTGETDQALVDKYTGHSCKLRPASEPIVVLRKPISEKSITENIIKHGTGGVDITSTRFFNEDKFRFPSNFIHDNSPEVLEQFAEYSNANAPKFFFYPKPHPTEKNIGCENLEKKSKNYTGSYAKTKNTKPQGNHHDTCKPIELMKHLIELYIPKNGVLVDCFNGSGTTGVSAIELEEYSYIGMEAVEDYCKISEARMTEHLRLNNSNSKLEVIKVTKQLMTQNKINNFIQEAA